MTSMPGTSVDEQHQLPQQQQKVEVRALELPPPSARKAPRGSVSVERHADSTRRVSIATRAIESFRERRTKSASEKSSKGEKSTFSCGFASLKPANEEEEEAGGCWSDPVNGAMKEDDCEQLVGKTAEDYLADLPERATNALRRMIENGERKEDEYFIWMRKAAGAKMVVLSVKCVENHLAGVGGRRVKWRNVSTGRVSIYRYSIAVIPVSAGARIGRFLRAHRKMGLIMVWLLFVALICLTVVLGSVNSDAPSQGVNVGPGTPRMGG